MGSSAQVDIFFGVFLGNESWAHSPDYEELPKVVRHEEFDNEVARLSGHQEPTTEYQKDKTNHQKFWTLREQARKDCPVTLVYGGARYDGSPDISLAIKASHCDPDWEQNAYSLTKSPIRTASPEQMIQWVALLKEWAEKLDLPWDKIMRANPDGPEWYAVASYG